MSAYPRHAVSAAEPLCTHGKDHPGLGPPLTPSNYYYYYFYYYYYYYHH